MRRLTKKYYIVSHYSKTQSKKHLLEKFNKQSIVSLFGEAERNFFLSFHTDILIVASYHYERLFPMQPLPDINYILFSRGLKRDLKFLSSAEIKSLWLELEHKMKAMLQYHHFVDPQIKPKISRGSRAIVRTESGGPDYTW